jgi:hypothetical protein
VSASSETILLPDAEPLITLSYADALDLLFKPGWNVALVDMVLHEVTRNETPTSGQLAAWVDANDIPITTTEIYNQYRREQVAPGSKPKKANLGERAIQEVMNGFAHDLPPKMGVFLFEDHKIARAGFLLPHNCRKVSTRAFLRFLEQHDWLDSADAIERRTLDAGRSFSRLHYPPK